MGRELSVRLASSLFNPSPFAAAGAASLSEGVGWGGERERENERERDVVLLASEGAEVALAGAVAGAVAVAEVAGVVVARIVDFRRSREMSRKGSFVCGRCGSASYCYVYVCLVLDRIMCAHTCERAPHSRQRTSERMNPRNKCCIKSTFSCTFSLSRSCLHDSCSASRSEMKHSCASCCS